MVLTKTKPYLAAASTSASPVLRLSMEMSTTGMSTRPSSLVITHEQAVLDRQAIFELERSCQTCRWPPWTELAARRSRGRVDLTYFHAARCLQHGQAMVYHARVTWQNVRGSRFIWSKKARSCFRMFPAGPWTN